MSVIHNYDTSFYRISKCHDLLRMSIDIAIGMSYLAAVKLQGICSTSRLDENYVVKVGDFGLAGDVYPHLYY